MATARFQVVSLPRRAPAPAPAPARGSKGREVATVSGERTAPPARRFVWRFLAANNRSLAQATTVYPDADSCIAAMREMMTGLTTAECELARDEDGLWVWSVRSRTEVVASTHRYPRQVRARLTCDTFLALASTPSMFDNVQVVYR